MVLQIKIQLFKASATDTEGNFFLLIAYFMYSEETDDKKESIRTKAAVKSLSNTGTKKMS